MYSSLPTPLQELNVPTEPSDMSFAVSLRGRTFEWSSDGLAGLFATRANLASPSFASMISDMLRFNKCVYAVVVKQYTAPYVVLLACAERHLDS